jgi:predicted nucleic acid-binding protein
MDVHRLYVDTNVFIYAFESDDARAERLRMLLSTLRPQPFLATSELTLSETLAGAYRQSDESLIEIYSHWTTTNPYIEVGPVTRDVLWAAAILRSQTPSLKLPDAIHLTTAFTLGCSHFLTGDSGLKGEYAFVDTRFQAGNNSKRLRILRPEPAVLEDVVAGL